MSKFQQFNLSDEQKAQLMRFDATDYGNARSIELLFGDKVRQVKGWGTVVYNGRYWDKDNAASYLNSMVIATLQMRGKLALDAQAEAIQKVCRTTNACVNGATEAFLRLESILADASSFDSNPFLLNVANGVVDLRNGNLTPHSPEFLFTTCSPVAYNPEANSALWEEQLAKTILEYDTQEIQDFVQMCAGYSITGRMNEEKLFFLHGPTRSGKSLFIMIMRAILGDKLAGATAFKTFSRNRDGNDQGFDLAPLHSCRFVGATEGKSDESLNEAVVKNLTGRDPVTACFKGLDSFTFLPKWKIWLASNFKVKGDVNDDAFWNRLIVIPFPNSFAGQEDKSLKEKLLQPEVLEGVLLWAVRGAQMWFNQADGLTTPQVFKDALQEAKDELDSVGRWMHDNCTTEDATALSPVGSLYDDYIKWCEDVDTSKPWSQKAFSNYLLNKGFKSTKAYFVAGHKNGREIKKQARAFAGIDLIAGVHFI